MEKYVELLESIVEVAVMSVLGNRKLVRLLVALFGGKKPDLKTLIFGWV